MPAPRRPRRPHGARGPPLRRHRPSRTTSRRRRPTSRWSATGSPWPRARTSRRERSSRSSRRRTKFSRKAVGGPTVEQILAANIDVVFLVTSLNGELNPGASNATLLAAGSGALPVILLNKADLEPDPERVAEVEAVARARRCSRSPASPARPRRAARPPRPGRTAALLGSSGVGKSTLSTASSARSSRDTGAPRRRQRPAHDDPSCCDAARRRRPDRHPRHARTATVEGGRGGRRGPRRRRGGRRGAAASPTARTRASPAVPCRRRSRAARLDGGRLESYRKLRREQAYLERRIDKRAASEERKRWKSVSKQSREAARAKGRRS